MAETIVTKTGGTSNCNLDAFELTLPWAEASAIHIASAPGILENESGPHAGKVTDMGISSWKEYEAKGDIADTYPNLITGRFDPIYRGLDRNARGRLPLNWLNTISERVRVAASLGLEEASMLGEELMAELCAAALGRQLLDPGESPHNLDSNRTAWRGWLAAVFVPGKGYVMTGNKTKVDGRPRTFSRGGSDTSAGFASDAIRADLHLNLTDGGAKSAHPKLIGNDRVIHRPHMLYVEGRELGRNGTGLVHSEAMVPLMIGNIPTQIRSTFDRNAPYTDLNNDESRAARRAGRVIALSLMENIVVHTVHEPGMAEGVGRLGDFDTAMATKGVAIIDSQGDGVDRQQYFVDADQADIAAQALRDHVRDGVVESSDALSFITLVGYNLKNRHFDNAFELALNTGLDGKSWQSDGFPISYGRHSTRIGVNPDDAHRLLSNMHQTLIESHIGSARI